ncbi:MAG: LysM peptidoglycan-binding domain-containing protein [Candidatus Thiodiazotropha sp. (ex Dulcina madagascariensis)]|nr:LysM peptidoglycan-binding domain-containing protein [Candidatus Thiodiazotropha sp. (ex Epidulcina cf. delphinae)]MCU7922514.1 LysM peptidoglycan-binding domain-containing protein [Candidatus Thiodiazotropha sp. (ex Dulcina madagascariensis)]MCU7925860.1 LysM peptidoglycan-binding domain-containing protein [Candidatus Thiodiazotropha sp. (ex Dulcina madagascariensis)]
MMPTPIQTAGQGLVRAYLEIIAPENVPEPIVPLHFNPTEYQLQKNNNFAEVPIPGLESPPIQFVRGGCEKLSAELLADTSDTLEDVRLKYTNKLRDLMRINTDLHAPPIVRLIWDDQVFKGVIESLNITYLLFSPEGIPWRAKISLALKEYRPVEIQVAESPTSSPDVEKFHTLVRGETLAVVAWKAFGDATQWREIAAYNDIKDPRHIEPGTVLNIPRLR